MPPTAHRRRWLPASTAASTTSPLPAALRLVIGLDSHRHGLRARRNVPLERSRTERRMLAFLAPRAGATRLRRHKADLLVGAVAIGLAGGCAAAAEHRARRPVDRPARAVDDLRRASDLQRAVGERSDFDRAGAVLQRRALPALWLPGRSESGRAVRAIAERLVGFAPGRERRREEVGEAMAAATAAFPGLQEYVDAMEIADMPDRVSQFDRP